MCKYGYYYFSGCRHQKIILFNFCENAPSVSKPEDTALEETTTINPGKHNTQTCDDDGKGSGGRDRSGGSSDGGTITEGTLHTDNTDLPSLCSTAETPSSLSHKSSFDTPASVSITTEHHCLACSSLPPEHLTQPSSPSKFADSSDDKSMAGLPLFGGTFRHWMGGGNATAAPKKGPTEALQSMTSATLSNSRLRESGIRQHTDESCDLPKSNEIIQHLAESCRNGNAENAGLDGFSITSCDSSVTDHGNQDDFNTARHAYDDIEAEIDQLKEDITKLKQEADHDRVDGYKKHTLLQLQASSHISDERQPRKLSYADMASHGTKSDKSDASTVRGAMPTCALITDSVPDPGETRDEDEYSVIISRRNDPADSPIDDPVIVWKGVQAVQNGKPENKQPRFAQPTQSFSRRTGDTLQAASSPMSSKSSPGGSPTKTTKFKEPHLATDRRAAQRQQKRKSLPGDWLGAAIPSTDVLEKVPAPKAATGVISTTDQHMVSTAEPISHGAGEVLKVIGGLAKDNAATVRGKAKDAQPKSPCHARTKSYMAPTSAATQRTIATLGQEKAKRDVQDHKPSEQSPTPMESRAAFSQRCSTASSEVSSVQFILDQPRPDFSLVHSPNRSNAPSSPMKSDDPRYRTRTDSVISPSKTTLPHNRRSWSPSKVPAASPHVARRIQPAAPRNQTPTRLRGFGSMPEVPNTTTTRRTSHGHILQPIVACLDAKGLLNKTSPNNAVVESYLKMKSAESPKDPLVVSSDAGVEQDPNAVFPRTAVGEGLKKGFAPHLREARDISHASTSTDATICPEEAPAVAFMTQARMPLDKMAGWTPDGGSAMPPLPEPARNSSLRATAHVFKPMVSSEVAPVHMDVEELMEYHSPDDWYAMTFQQRMAVRDLRNQYNNGAPTFPRTHPLQQPLQRTATAFPDRMDGGNTMAHHNADNRFTKAIDENGSPHPVQAGQVIRPTLSPGKKSVHWMLRDVDGKETPIKFGRAAAPTVDPIWDPPTPALSSNAPNEASSLNTTPLSRRGWHIGSASSPVPYGWRGGDGKEIKFVGYGPHAERDPNSVVNFNFRGRMASYNNAAVPNGFDGGAKENHRGPSPSPSVAAEGHVAPRSQRQWAEKFGFMGPGGVGRVPCGDMEIVKAVEHCIPFGSQLAGYCFDCMAG